MIPSTEGTTQRGGGLQQRMTHPADGVQTEPLRVAFKEDWKGIGFFFPSILRDTSKFQY